MVHVRRPSSTSRRRRRRSPIKSVRQGVFVASAVMFAFGLLATVISCTIFICFKEKKRFGVYLYTTLCRLCHYAASASQPLKPGTLSLYLPVPVPVLIPFVVTSRPTTASRPFNPLNPSLLAPQIFLTIVRVYNYYIYLLTDLLMTYTRNI